MTNQPRTETLPSAQLIKKGQLSINPINNKPFTGITIEHYHNNNNPFDISKIKTRTAFTQGKKDGLEEYFFKSGKLKYRMSAHATYYLAFCKDVFLGTKWE